MSTEQQIIGLDDDDAIEAATATFDELEELLESSVNDGKEIDPLDALLAESLAERKEEADAKAARERLKRGGLSAKEKAEDEERIRRWQLAHEWKAVANAALFERHECACGAHFTVFRQLLTRQVHRHLKFSQRWEAAQAAAADLPNEVIIKRTRTPMCVKCAPAKAGFAFHDVQEWQG